MLLRQKNVIYREEISKEVLMSPSQSLPFLMDKIGKCSAGADLINLLSEKPSDVDYFRVIVEERLRPIWTAAIWADPAIFKYILRPIYQTPKCFLVQEYLIQKRRFSITWKGHSEDDYDKFRVALEELSETLGEEMYFDGSQVGELDALVGPDLMFIPFYLPASHRLHQIYSEFHNLYDYSIHLLHHFRS